MSRIQLRKKRLALGAEQFNRSPKKGLEFLQGIGLLPEPLDAAAVAGFFHTAPGLDKTAVGAYLGEPDQFSLDVRPPPQAPAPRPTPPRPPHPPTSPPPRPPASPPYSAPCSAHPPSRGRSSARVPVPRRPPPSPAAPPDAGPAAGRGPRSCPKPGRPASPAVAWRPARHRRAARGAQVLAAYVRGMDFARLKVGLAGCGGRQ